MKSFLSLPFYHRLASVLIIIIALGYLVYLGKFILLPFILGNLFALLLLPVGSFLERKLRLPRSFASFLTVVIFFGLIGFLLYKLASQLSILKDDWPAFQHQLSSSFSALQHWVDITFHVDSQKQMEILNDTAKKSVDSGTLFLGVALASLSSIFITTVFVFLYTFFMLLYRRHVVKFLLLLTIENYHPIVLDILSKIQHVVKRYLIGLVIQMILVIILVYIALLIIGVKYSLLLAVITGVFNILPYVGIFTSIIVICIITFATAGLSHVLLVIAALLLIHAIDGNYIVPKIVGSQVKINSLFAMLAIIIGEMIWGLSGMFLAIPLLAITKIVFDSVVDLKPWGYLLGEEENETNNLAEVLVEKKSDLPLNR